MKKYPASEKDIFPVSAYTSNFDEWSALAGFLADMIEKYAEILIPEIEAGQIAFDELLAAGYNVLVIAVQTHGERISPCSIF